MNIYVGNLDFKVTDNDLENMFSTYGKVSSSKIIIDKYSAKSKGFGFVTMDDENEAGKAISSLNGSSFENRDLIVSEARPKKSSFYK